MPIFWTPDTESAHAPTWFDVLAALARHMRLMRIRPMSSEWLLDTRKRTRID